MSILFTQYLRPFGIPRPMKIDRPPDIEKMAQAIIAKGMVFEVEELTTGDVSLTIGDKVKEEDIAIQLCENGPAVPEAVDKLVKEGFAYINRETLWETLPKEFRTSEYCNADARRYKDVKVVSKHESHKSPWPGPHKNVHYWWTLENGKRVGWNENPARGWSFPVI